MVYENFKTNEEKEEDFKKIIKDLNHKGFLGLSDNLWERITAAEILGKRGDSRAIPHLIKALDDRNSELRKEAARALGNIRNPIAIPYLINRFEREKDEFVMIAIMEVFSLKIKDPKTVPILIKTLSDDRQIIRGQAISALSRIGNPIAVPHLINALRDPVIQIREVAANALKNCIDSSSIPILKKSLLDNNDVVRRIAEDCLRNIQ